MLTLFKWMPRHRLIYRCRMSVKSKNSIRKSTVNGKTATTASWWQSRRNPLLQNYLIFSQSR